MNEQLALSPHYWTTLMTTPAIYQTHTMGATISWLSQARLDCYLHGQAFPILQRKTLALLSADRIVNEIII